MYVGVLTLRLYLHGVDSLKAKRRVVAQVKDRTRGRFNAAVAEVGELELWQSATLGFSVVSNDGAQCNSALDQIVNFVDSLGLAELLDHSLEILSMKEA